jgi:hypothetical protein
MLHDSASSGPSGKAVVSRNDIYRVSFAGVVYIILIDSSWYFVVSFLFILIDVSLYGLQVCGEILSVLLGEGNASNSSTDVILCWSCMYMYAYIGDFSASVIYTDPCLPPDHSNHLPSKLHSIMSPIPVYVCIYRNASNSSTAVIICWC